MNARRILGVLVTLFLVINLVTAAYTLGWAASTAVSRLGRGAELGELLPLEVATATPRDDEVDLALFWEAMALLNEHFYGEVPTGDEVMYSAIRGVVEATGDPHTAFVDARHADLLESDLQGEFEGIGATVQMDNEDITIVAPLPNSPAERAGIMAGDVIVAADGVSLRGMHLMEAIGLIRGPRGTTVRLTIRRAGLDELLDIEIVRDRIIVKAVESRVIEAAGGARIGYLRLNDFGARAPDEVVRALVDLQSNDLTGLIVDLRNNPGGYLGAAVRITSQFIGEGLILTERGSNGLHQEHRAIRGGAALEIPLVVLVNEGSASASEILAGAIQDSGRGTIIGTTTFGKGSVQVAHRLRDGSSLRVTIARWFTPSDRAIHEVGIEPDIVVDLTPADARSGRDPQLDRAIQFLVEGQ